MLDVLSKRHERDKGKMVRWLIKVAVMSVDVGDCMSSVCQACVSDVSSVCLASDGFSQSKPGTDHALQFTSEKKEEKEEEKKRAPQLAPLDVTKRILDDLNERTGNGYQARGKVARRLIQSRMNDGHEEADFIEVNRKMAMQWMGNPKMEHCLNYETLYGPKFEKYIGQREVVKEQKPDWVRTKESNQRSIDALWDTKKEQPHERRIRLEKEAEVNGQS